MRRAYHKWPQRNIYIYNTVSNRWKGCETDGVYTNLAA